MRGGVPRQWLTIVCCLLFGLAIAGCQLISNYDEILDKGVTDLQRKTDAFLLKLQDPQSPLRKYAAAKPSYDDILNDIHSLKVRAEANNSGNLNEKTIQLIDLIDDSFRKIQDSHVKLPAGMDVRTVRDAQGLLDTLFDSTLKLEIAKKRTAAKG